MNIRTKLLMVAAILSITSLTVGAEEPIVVNDTDITKIDYKVFVNPPADFRGIYWMSFNISQYSRESMQAEMKRVAETGKWGNFMIEPTGGSTSGFSDEYMAESRRKPVAGGMAYLDSAYLKCYREYLEEGLKYGLQLSCLYDDWSYPSGTAGGLFYSKYPDLCAKTLKMEEQSTSSRQKLTLTMPEGNIFMGAVAMNLDNYNRIDISNKLLGNILTYTTPSGNWKVMLFYLDPQFYPKSAKGGYVDYLDHDAVAKYIHLNFDPYYDALKEYFGSVIKRTIFDEPTMMSADGKMWTPKFNDEFEAVYHFSPVTYYPALWYNIGSETEPARNALFGFRTELFARNYLGQINQWCEAHGIKGSGHLDQEESMNPVGANGDMLKVFKYQGIPALDDIYYSGRSNVAYKIVASSAYNYDKPDVLSESFAAYRTISPEIVRRVTMDQIASGINIHWEWRGVEKYKTPEWDDFIARACYLTRAGRHVADIGVVYPIASLQSTYYFSELELERGGHGGHHYAYEGGVAAPETDYMNLGEILTRGIHTDFTYLHPEVIAAQCEISGNRLRMKNERNWEEYKVIIIPGGKTMSVAAMNKILEFYRNGGTVIATSQLPEKSTEFGRDAELREMVYEIFGLSSIQPTRAKLVLNEDVHSNYFINSNKQGGYGYFIPRLYSQIVEQVLNRALPVKDVRIDIPADYYVRFTKDYEGGVTYLHKVKDSRDIYYFANTTSQPLNTSITLSGDKQLELWDPHTGTKNDAKTEHSTKDGQAVTVTAINLEPLSSVFFISK